MSFTLLWQKILRSSLWVQESKETRIVWIALLALKDKDGVIQSSLVGLADAAKVTVEECSAALETLLAPDLNDTSGVEEGRRIRKVQGGWQIVNSDMYRFSTEAKREFWRQSQQDYRQTKKAQAPAKAVLPTPPVNPPRLPEKPPKPEKTPPLDCVVIFTELNDLTGSKFRPEGASLAMLGQRLAQPGVTTEGVLQMVRRQAKLWKDDPKMREFLRPTTLFNNTKFNEYYAAREQPIPNFNAVRQIPQSVDRNVGNANEGKAHLYKGLGSLSVPDRP